MDFEMQRIRKMSFVYFIASLFFLNFENLSAMDDFTAEEEEILESGEDEGILMKI